MQEDLTELMIMQPAADANEIVDEPKEELRGTDQLLNSLQANFKTKFKTTLDISNVNGVLTDGLLYSEMNTLKEWSKI